MTENSMIKYAETVLVSGVNIQKGQYLIISCPIPAREIAHVIAKKAYDLGAKRVYIDWRDFEFNKIRVEKEELTDLTSLFDFEIEARNSFIEKDVCRVAIVCENPDLFVGVDPIKKDAYDRAMSVAFRPFMSAQMSNKIRWCVCAYPEKSWAKKLFPDLSDEDAMNNLWDMICKAMRLDTPDPVKAWADFAEKAQKRADILNNSKIDRLHYKNSLGTDLIVGMMEDSIWLSAKELDKNGIPFIANIPTEEIFSAPHKLRVDGTLCASLPLSYGGNIIDGFTLKFEKGRIVSYSAKVGEEYLKNIIETDEGSHYLGEIALVQQDSPISNMNTLFYETLFDENASCHFAFGEGYPTCVKASETLSGKVLVDHGLNDSLQHVDFMVGTKDLEITAYLKDGSTMLIMKDGNFVI